MTLIDLSKFKEKKENEKVSENPVIQQLFEDIKTVQKDSAVGKILNTLYTSLKPMEAWTRITVNEITILLKEFTMLFMLMNRYAEMAIKNTEIVKKQAMVINGLRAELIELKGGEVKDEQNTQ